MADLPFDWQGIRPNKPRAADKPTVCLVFAYGRQTTLAFRERSSKGETELNAKRLRSTNEQQTIR